jgi:hypothetical protein
MFCAPGTFFQPILYTVSTSMIKQSLPKILKTFRSLGEQRVTNPFLYNRAVLYFLVFFTLSEIAYLVNQNDTASVMTLVLIGLLTAFFNKNMIIILLTTLVLTNLLRFVQPKKDYILSEGFEDNTEKETASSAKTSSDKKSSKADKKSSEKEEDVSLKLKEDFAEFQTVQKKIMDSMNDLTPLLDKAESFIQKYEQYKNMKDK